MDGISFTVGRGETLGLVGESGCGKSTTSSMITRLLDPTSGRILFDGEDIGAIPASRFARLPLRRRIQMVFQDPTDSLNPRFTAERAIADPILRLGADTSRDSLRARCETLARQVGLPLDLLDRFPHQLSGGQKARVGIARAIALNPDLVILDEPTAALDVSVQAVVLNLLADLKAELGMSYIFVSHDLHVVRLLCDRVIVMRSGRIEEQGPTGEVLSSPAAAYTRELLARRSPRPAALSRLRHLPRCTGRLQVGCVRSSGAGPQKIGSNVLSDLPPATDGTPAAVPKRGTRTDMLRHQLADEIVSGVARARHAARRGPVRPPLRRLAHAHPRGDPPALRRGPGPGAPASRCGRGPAHAAGAAGHVRGHGRARGACAPGSRPCT